MTALLSFIVTIGLLVTIHEYGHFIVARFFDVKVLRFSIGFGQPLWKKTFGKDKTELVIAAIPLGGYVKMLDEQAMAGEEKEEDITNYSDADLSRAYNRQSVFKRMAIVLAGPIANLLLAIVIYWGLFSAGVVGLKPIIGEVLPETPAAIAGLQSGDSITSINQTPIQSWQDVRWHVINATGGHKALSLTVKSDKNKLHTHELTLNALNNANPDKDPLTQLGLTAFQPTLPPVFGQIVEGGAAENAGLKTKDQVISVNGEDISDWARLVTIIQQSAGKQLHVLIERGEVRKTIALTPKPIEANGKVIGKIGAGVDYPDKLLQQYIVTSNYSVKTALQKAVAKTWDTAIFSLKMLGRMVTGDVSWKMMSGPVTIADYAGQSANLGLKPFFSFLALVSISIGVLNLLPIPMLDGGHFMYYVIELLSGKPVSTSLMMFGQRVGLALIGSMMVLAFYNDINRLVAG